MKTCFLLILISISVNSFAQEKVNLTEYYKAVQKKYGFKMDSSMECECAKGINNAILASNEGKLKYYFVGLMHFTYASYISYVCRKYEIDGEETGCLVDMDVACFNLYVDKVLEKKFGKGFWKTVARETDSLRQRGELDREAFYTGGDKKLERDFVRTFKQLFPSNRLSKIEIEVTVTLDSTGKILNIVDNGYVPAYNFKYIVPVLQKLQNWQPAIRDGEKIKYEFRISEMYAIR